MPVVGNTAIGNQGTLWASSNPSLPTATVSNRFPQWAQRQVISQQGVADQPQHDQHLLPQQLQGQVLGHNSHITQPVLCQQSPQQAYVSNLNFHQQPLQQPQNSQQPFQFGGQHLVQTGFNQHQTRQHTGTMPALDLTQHCYEWVTDSSGRQILVRTPLPPAQPIPVSDAGRAQQQAVMPQQFRTEFRCYPSTGR